MSLQDPQANRVRVKNDQFPPKLRKNRKLELRWGNDYYEAVHKAVFITEYLPYMPTEPPWSIKEDVDKTGYVCKQCRDCFRFLSSIEEHTSRRSWVLGYWCQACFTTKCTHVGEDELMCSTCRNVEASKHAYLTEKGVRRNLKKAVTRVFYNQCQFFAHLRMHGIVMVDLSEVMLMPLPSGIEPDDYGLFDKLCKALIETMFIRRIHIMDWLREMNIPPDRWQVLFKWMESDHKTPITDIIERYAEDCLNTSDLAARQQKESVAEQDDVGKTSGSGGSPTSEKDPLAEDDDLPNDIAFVDCGPTPSHVILSEFPNVNANNKIGNDATSDRANSLWRSFSQQYDKYRDKPREIAPKPNKEIVQRSVPLPQPPPQATINRKSPRVLTIRSPKTLSLSTIMKHLPIEGISSKNIFVVADDPQAEKSLTATSAELKNKEKSATNAIDVTTNKKIKGNPKINVSTNIDINSRGIPLITKSQSFSEQMSLHGRIVFQNGRKYIIRHMPKVKSQSLLQDSVVKKGPLPVIAPVTSTRPLFPKSVQPTKITLATMTTATTTSTTTTATARTTTSSDQSQRPKTQIRASRRSKVPPKMTTPSGFSLTAIKANLTSQSSKARITKIQKNLMVRCREVLMNDLRRATKRELETYIDHLKAINAKYATTMNFENDTVLTNNMRTIRCFDSISKAISIMPRNNSTNEMPLVQDNFDINAREWETRIKDTEKLRNCGVCCKKVKPANYIAGMSEPAKDETIYCQCYNNVCYVCDANQGSLIQLKAHVKWHKGEKPYMCPSCSIVFPSVMELEIHVWTTCFHPMARYIYGCGVCDIEGILDMESVAQHFLLLHTRRKVICAECKIEYSSNTPSYADYTKHFAQHHGDIENITEPKRLLVCNLKQCIIRPELFRAHLSDHIGVLKWVYYKCPFCTVITQGSSRNKSLMREHLIANHLDRMHEVVSNESLTRIIDGIKLTSSLMPTITDEMGQMCQVLNADPTGPKILDARTITPATFEFGSDNNEGPMEVETLTLPRILEVRSEAIEEFGSEKTRENDFELEILSVKSIADNSVDSSTSDCQISTFSSHRTTEDFVKTSNLHDNIECEDSNFHDEITVISMNSNVDEDMENSSCLIEHYDENEESMIKSCHSLPHLKSLLKSKNIPQRPWRIALNSPTDVEIEPIVYNCHLCGELINTSATVIKSHFAARHSSDYEIFTVSPSIPRVTINLNEGIYRDDSNDGKKRKNEITPPAVSKRRKRWGPKKYIERPGSPSLGICVKPESLQDIEGNFRCKKCDELFKDRTKLREHIAMQHRIKGQYLICLECGENFVVVPSLQMHLKALHGIQDPITYLAKNTAYAPDIFDDTEEDEKAMESNQCYVCMAVFENKPALDKHIRVHGMAFLRRKRFEAQKALKSSALSNTSTDVNHRTGSIEGIVANKQNDGKLMKTDDSNDTNIVAISGDDGSSKNPIQDEKTITEIEIIETSSTT